MAFYHDGLPWKPQKLLLENGVGLDSVGAATMSPERSGKTLLLYRKRASQQGSEWTQLDELLERTL